MIKIIKNNTSSAVPINDVGITIAANSSYQIPTTDYDLWGGSENAVTLIQNETIYLNDGQNNLSKKISISLLQNNIINLVNHYTLVDDDGILMGNGEMLFLNDEFQTTSNVSEYLDDHIEDNQPTEII